MSMKDWAVNDYGMVLDDECIKAIIESDKDKFAGLNYEDDICDMFYVLSEMLTVEYISEFTGEAFLIKDDGANDFFNSICYDSDVVLYVPLSRLPSLFNGPYKNIDDIVGEMKDKMVKYLGDDFDYRSRLRNIIGTYYG